MDNMEYNDEAYGLEWRPIYRPGIGRVFNPNSRLHNMPFRRFYNGNVYYTTAYGKKKTKKAKSKKRKSKRKKTKKTKKTKKR